MIKKYGIVGSRTWTDESIVRSIVYSLPDDAIIVSGGAKGVDSLAEKFAKERGLETIIHLPKWETFGKSAGYIRNRLIVQDSDIIIAFWDGVSKGTKHTIDIAEELGVECVIVYDIKS